jgi:prepilin-type N-terminal cleavage/methylation domain-containing protein
MKKINQKGFTLIELLIVIGIIAILAAAVIITVTPGEKLEQARNATRNSHMTAIGTALHMGLVDNLIPSLVSTCVNATWTTWTDFSDDCAQGLGLSVAPVDPQTGALYQTALSSATGNRIRVKTPATTPTDGEIIKVF